MDRVAGKTTPSFTEQYLPKLATVLREGYGFAAFRADAVAGLTVAIVALPLSMAIAIASGVGPDRGLVTAIVGGAPVSALGGSRLQVGGPAGAFIILVAACVAQIGVRAVVGAVILTRAFTLPVETIGSRFGELPRTLPAPQLPGLSPAAISAALPYAISFTLLGAIGSLLSAVVADGMTGRRHRSNAELVAQGVANTGSALFGGIVVTGTIARTAANRVAGAGADGAAAPVCGQPARNRRARGPLRLWRVAPAELTAP